MIMAIIGAVTLGGILFAWVVYRDMQHGTEPSLPTIDRKHLIEELERMEK